MKKIIEREIQALDQAIGPFSAADKTSYAWWLSQTHYFVCHSTRLLALAASRFGRSDEELHFRFAEHIGEERGHEHMATRDLKALGFKLADYDELPETQAFYQSQYYWIEHVDPIAFFGYILCLEAFSVNSGIRLYKEALAAFGDRATVFMKVHTEEDVDHLGKAVRLVEGLSPEKQQIVLKNFRLSCRLYAAVYEAILKQSAATTTLRQAA
jgi:hypothetical protein